MHDYSRRLGDAVKRAREAQGLTQSELAEKIAVAPRTILNIENYKGNPKLEILALVIYALKIDPRKIFFLKLPIQHKSKSNYNSKFLTVPMQK